MKALPFYIRVSNQSPHLRLDTLGHHTLPLPSSHYECGGKKALFSQISQIE